jgi:CheY-like chemotaxis protein
VDAQAAAAAAASQPSVDAGDSSPALVSERKSRGGRVLLVEDNHVNQKMGRRILEQYGFSVDVAEDGIAAIHKVDQQAYDVILMDVNMPRMDGVEATRRIRERRIFTPIIALTASATQEEKERCLQAGMSFFLTKPFRPRELQAVVEDAMENNG